LINTSNVLRENLEILKVTFYILDLQLDLLIQSISCILKLKWILHVQWNIDFL